MEVAGIPECKRLTSVQRMKLMGLRNCCWGGNRDGSGVINGIHKLVEKEMKMELKTTN